MLQRALYENGHNKKQFITAWIYMADIGTIELLQ